MKSKSSKVFEKICSNWFYICIIAVSLFGISMGLADLDYYWQKDLGRQIITEFNFNGVSSQVWGSIGVHEYYDHEWLCNIIFYLFSLIPYKPLIWLKLFICLCTGIEFLRFLSFIKFENLNKLKLLQALVIYTLYILVFCKVKAYSFSILFFLEEFILLEKYCKKEKLSYIIRLGFLYVLWTNFHSGSMPLFFVTAGVYWLTKVRKKKVLLYGVVIALSTLINPYGYKLIAFNLFHNFDNTMKTLIADWRGLDAKTSIGVLCALIILYFVGLMITQRKQNITYILMSFIVLFMSFGSIRHLIYLMPFIFIAIENDKFSPVLAKLNTDYVMLFCVGLSILVCITTFITSDYVSYSDNMIDSKLADVISKEVDSNSIGLFNDHDYISMTEYGKKNFVTGAYPLISDRYKDLHLMLNWGTETQVKNIIDYYNLDKFIFNKYNTSVSYYDIYNPLYEYLSNNSDYECLYDSDMLVFFKRKG